MRGLTRSCALQLALWAAMIAVIYAFATLRGRSGAAVWVASVAGGLLVSMALLVAGNTLKTIRERRMLAAAMMGTTPPDGAWIAICGEVRCGSPVRGPISGEEVALYEYSIARYERIGRTSSLVPYFDGKALAPTAIVTPRGDVQLLTVPQLELEPDYVESKRALANARDHIARAIFERRDTAQQRTSALEREWTDDDGMFRIDKRYTDAAVDLEDGFLLEERHIKPGETVCAFGVYSAARSAIVVDERWGRRSRLLRAAPAEASRALGGRVIRYAVLSLLLAAAAAGVVAAL